MAAAGFYHCPTDQEPDCVKCFVCFKELDGWEPDDDPWQEHLSHASKCPFLKLKKSVENLTMHEFLKLQTVIQKNKAQMMLKTEFALFDKQVEAVKNEMLRLI